MGHVVGVNRGKFRRRWGMGTVSCQVTTVDVDVENRGINLLMTHFLAGGFKYLLFSPLFGEDFQLD